MLRGLDPYAIHQRLAGLQLLAVCVPLSVYCFYLSARRLLHNRRRSRFWLTLTSIALLNIVQNILWNVVIVSVFVKRSLLLPIYPVGGGMFDIVCGALGYLRLRRFESLRKSTGRVSGRHGLSSATTEVASTPQTPDGRNAMSATPTRPSFRLPVGRGYGHSRTFPTMPRARMRLVGGQGMWMAAFLNFWLWAYPLIFLVDFIIYRTGVVPFWRELRRWNQVPVLTATLINIVADGMFLHLMYRHTNLWRRFNGFIWIVAFQITWAILLVTLIIPQLINKSLLSIIPHYVGVSSATIDFIIFLLVNERIIEAVKNAHKDETPLSNLRKPNGPGAHPPKAHHRKASRSRMSGTRMVSNVSSAASNDGRYYMDFRDMGGQEAPDNKSSSLTHRGTFATRDHRSMGRQDAGTSGAQRSNQGLVTPQRTAPSSPPSTSTDSARGRYRGANCRSSLRSVPEGEPVGSHMLRPIQATGNHERPLAPSDRQDAGQVRDMTAPQVTQSCGSPGVPRRTLILTQHATASDAEVWLERRGVASDNRSTFPGAPGGLARVPVRELPQRTELGLGAGGSAVDQLDYPESPQTAASLSPKKSPLELLRTVKSPHWNRKLG